VGRQIARRTVPWYREDVLTTVEDRILSGIIDPGEGRTFVMNPTMEGVLRLDGLDTSDVVEGITEEYLRIRERTSGSQRTQLLFIVSHACMARLYREFAGATELDVANFSRGATKPDVAPPLLEHLR
jgi:hypothetical protein